MVTVIARRTKLFIFSSLNAWVGSFILPPWMVLESKRIRSPALHSTSMPVPTKGSFFFSYTQSDLLSLVQGYLSTSDYWDLSLFVLGTTCSPPAPSALTSIRGIIPWTQWNPFLFDGFWSVCRFYTNGDQWLLEAEFHQGRQQMKVSKLVIS
jgi:hypothetical protein